MKASAASSAANSAPASPSSPTAEAPPVRLAPTRLRLSGVSRRPDLRVHAARADIADIALAGIVLAPHYAVPLIHGCIRPSTPILRTPDTDSPAVSELLHGERFAVVDVTGDWAWGYGLHDRYVGHVALAALGLPAAATHRVVLPALVFADADIKAPVRARLPVGARIAGVADGAFVAIDGGHVHHRHVRPIDTVEDAVAAAARLIGAPYRWGGRSGDGIDCSGLVQHALDVAGHAAPRDSDQQAEALGRSLAEDEPLAAGDLVFWPGHVGLMADADTIIHANAHWMAVTREPLADVVARNPAPISMRRRP